MLLFPNMGLVQEGMGLKHHCGENTANQGGYYSIVKERVKSPWLRKGIVFAARVVDVGRIALATGSQIFHAKTLDKPGSVVKPLSPSTSSQSIKV